MQIIGVPRLRRGLVPIAAVAVLGFCGVARAQTYTINTTADAPITASNECAPGGTCSLRAAVRDADNRGGQNTINLPAGTYTLTIASTGADDPATGDLDVDSTNLTITGAGSGSTIINANGIDRAFAVQNFATFSLSGVTIENGNPSSQSTGGRDGGAIWSDGGLTVTGDVAFDDNQSPIDGGAIYTASGANSTLAVAGASFSGNYGIGGGGGIYLDQPGAATITGSTFTTNGTGGNGSGGAVYGAGGSLTLASSTLSDNTAFSDGGAMFWDTSGSVMVTGSTFTGNTSDFGGAVMDSDSSAMTFTGDRFTGNWAAEGGALELDSSATTPAYVLSGDELDGNSASQQGGAVEWDRGTLSATGSSFVGNHGGDTGGALYLPAGNTLSLANDTVSGNSAQSGGGLSFASTTPVTLTNDTIWGNTAARGSGGGIAEAGDATTTSGSTGVQNTIVAENTGGDCGSSPPKFAGPADAGHNLDGDGSCFGGLGVSGDRTSVNPLLLATTNNGGSVLTDAEQPGSPAIDAGTNAGCPTTDARGLPRPAGSACDIGAYEITPAALAVAVGAPPTSTVNAALQYTVTVTAGGPGPSTSTALTDTLPAGSTLYGASPSQGTCTSAGSPATVNCELGTLANGASASVTLIASVGQAGAATDTATAGNGENGSGSGSAVTQVSNPTTSTASTPGGTTTSPTPATSTPSGHAPTATTGAATKTGSHRVKLTGLINPGNQATAYFFQYGTGKQYGQVTLLSRTGVGAAAVTAILNSLKQGTAYHYRLIAINGDGIAYGRDHTFKIAKPKAKKKK